MIFPQNHPAGTFEKGGESSFLTLFQNLFLLISPISHFLFSQIPHPFFLLPDSFVASTITSTYFQLFPPLFQPFSSCHFLISTFPQNSKLIFPPPILFLFRMLMRFIWFLHKSTASTTTTTFIFFFSYPFSAILLLSLIHFLKLFSFHSISSLQSNPLLYGNRTNLQQPATRKNILINPATLFLLHAHLLFSFSKFLKDLFLKVLLKFLSCIQVRQ